MNAEEFRTARDLIGKARGLSRPVTQHEMAKALRMGKHGWQTISAWENGKQPIPGPVQLAVKCLLDHGVIICGEGKRG